MMDQDLNLSKGRQELLDVARDLFGDTEAEATSEMFKSLDKMRVRDTNFAKSIRSTFSTASGKKTLGWLIDLSQQSREPGIEDLLSEPAENRAIMAGYRAGFRDVLTLIGDAINQANDAEGET